MTGACFPSEAKESTETSVSGIPYGDVTSANFLRARNVALFERSEEKLGNPQISADSEERSDEFFYSTCRGSVLNVAQIRSTLQYNALHLGELRNRKVCSWCALISRISICSKAGFHPILLRSDDVPLRDIANHEHLVWLEIL